MSRRALIFGLLVVGGPFLRSGEVLDRIAVAVNGYAILQSEWQDEVRYESFIGNRALSSITDQDRKAALDRLIDQELLREQAGTVETAPTSDEVEKQFASIKNDFVQSNGLTQWNEMLVSYSLSEADIRSHLTRELSQLRVVDARLRPSVQVGEDEIAAYYKSHLASVVGHPVSLQQAAKIREILTQEKINQALGSWLESLRSQAAIRIFASDSRDPQGAAQ